MKILLVSTNTNRFLSPPPIGIAFLVPPLQRARHDVRVLDMMYAKDPRKDLEGAMTTFRPDVVGFSIRNLDNHEMLMPDDPLPAIRGYVAQARDHGIRTVIGGTGFSTVPKAMLRFMEADYGIAGQGEDVLPLLLDAISTGSVDPSIPGLVRRKDGEIVANPPSVDGYRDKHPDWTALNLGRYAGAMFPAPVLIKSGCTFGCLYCNAGVASGTNVCARDIDSIIGDIRHLIEAYGVRRFYLVDSCLPQPLEFAKDLFRAMIRERLRIHFTANLEPARGCYDEELLDLYRRAGGLFALLGCESLSATMLTNYRKPFAIEDVLRWSTAAKRVGLAFGMELLIGGPGESEATVRETLEVLPEIDFSLFLYGIGVRIYPGTGLHEIAVSEGAIRKDDELLFPTFYVSPQLDVGWAKGCLRGTARRYSRRRARLLPMVAKLMVNRFLKTAI